LISYKNINLIELFYEIKNNSNYFMKLIIFKIKKSKLIFSKIFINILISWITIIKIIVRKIVFIRIRINKFKKKYNLITFFNRI